MTLPTDWEDWDGVGERPTTPPFAMPASAANAVAEGVNALIVVLGDATADDLEKLHAITAAAATLNGIDAAAEKVANKNQANGYAGLDGGGKISANALPATVMEYKGVWNASTNSPTLADGGGNTGDWYRVGTAGSRNLGSGSIVFDVGDYVLYNGSTWEKSDTTDAVASVAGLTGVITSGALKTAAALDQVDNTPDGSKPVSTAQAAADAAVLSSANSAAASGDAATLTTATGRAIAFSIALG